MAKHPADGRREAMCVWLTANGIDPKNVPQDADMTISEGTAGRFLCCEVFDRTSDGHIQLDERGDKAAITVITVPLKVEPPDWWQPYEKPTRDQLLQAVDRARKVIAERRAEVAEYEAENPPSEWSDAVENTCARIEHALTVYPPAQHVQAPKGGA